MARIRRNCVGKTTEQMMKVWKVAKYIRLSRDDGNVESESVANQRKILDEQIPSFFKDEYEIIDEYIDDGRTGTSDYTRPDFLRLVEDVKKGKINCIVTKNLSRAFRNSANQGKFLEEFIPLYHTRFISLYEPHIDTFLNPEIVHSLEVSITGFMNEQYAYKTSVDIRRTFDTKRKNGEFIGAFAPYGYKKSPENKNSLIIDEEAAEVVRDIFKWFVNEGMSKSSIVKHLNELGIPNPATYKRQHGFKYNNPQIHKNDGLWSYRTIHSILQNEMYIGNMVQGRQKIISYKVHDRISVDEKDWYVVENTHEAIVPREIFDKAQLLHSRDTRISPNKKSLHLFSGFLYCADCGKAMTRKTAREYVYYCCSTYRRKSQKHCTKHSISEKVLYEAVLLAIQKQIALIGSLSEIVKEIREAPVLHTESKRINNLLDSKQKELRKINTIMDNLYADWRGGEITKEEYRRMRLKFTGQAEQIETAISKLEKEKEAFAAGVSTEEPYFKTFLKYKNIDHLKRDILVELVNAVYIHESGAITIEFAFADQHRRVLEFIENNSDRTNILESCIAI